MSSSSNKSDPIRLSGIVRGIGWTPEEESDGIKRRRSALLRRTIVWDESGEVGRVEHFEKLGLFSNDGHSAEHIVVEVKPEVRVEPSKTTNAKWKDLPADDRESMTLSSSSKVKRDPSTPIEILRVNLHHNMHVELLAEDVEYAFDEATDLRAAPERRIVRVTTRAIAIGDNAATMLQSSVRRRRRRSLSRRN